MSTGYKGDTWESIQMDKQHTFTQTKTEQKLLHTDGNTSATLTRFVLHMEIVGGKRFNGRLRLVPKNRESEAIVRPIKHIYTYISATFNKEERMTTLFRPWLVQTVTRTFILRGPRSRSDGHGHGHGMFILATYPEGI